MIPGPPLRGTLSPPATSITYTVKSASSEREVGREVVAARLAEQQLGAGLAPALSSSTRRGLADVSRIAACGQPPVSTARMRSAGSAPFRVNSASSA